MFNRICMRIIESNCFLKNTCIVFVIALLLLDALILRSQENPLSASCYITRLDSSYVIYQNPRVYNVDYTFELFPDFERIDKSTDLKVWIPVPREWASQRAVRILAVEPEPHARYTDPEHGNPIYFWDFGEDAESKDQLLMVGNRLRYDSRFKKAIDIYNWIIELYPDWDIVYRSLADVYYYKGDKEMAIRNYARSLELNPTLLNTTYIIEMLYSHIA